MGIDAGRLRHVVDIEVRSDAQDATEGGLTTTWTPLFTNVRAAIEPVSVREFIGAGKVESDVTARIVVRFRPGLDSAQRIVHGRNCCAATVGLEIFNPEGPLRDKDTGLEYVTFPCSQGVNEG